MKSLLRLLVASILMAGLVAAASPIAASPADTQKQRPVVVMAGAGPIVTTCSQCSNPK